MPQMKYWKIIFTTLVLLIWIPFIKINSVFDGRIWGPHYYTIGLGSVLILVISSYLIFRKGALGTGITVIDIIIIFLMVYIGLQCLFMPFVNAYLPYFYILVVLAVTAKVFKPAFESSQCKLSAMICVFLLVGALEGGYGILQQTGLAVNSLSQFKVGGTFGNPGTYSNYLAAVFVFALGYFLHSGQSGRLKNYLRYFSLATAIIIAMALSFTGARTSWIVAILGLAMICWPLFKTWPVFGVLFGSIKKKVVSFSILGAIAIVVCIFLYQFKPQSAKGRLLIYEVSLAMIKEKPVFGHGFCRFPAEYNDYQAAYFKTHPGSDKAMLADNIKTGFNEFIQITVELGLTGLLLFIGFIILIFRSKPKPGWEYLVLPAQGALLALFICCLFSYPLRILPVAVTAVFLLAIVLAANTDKRYYFKISKWGYKPVVLVVSVTVLFVCYFQWKDFTARKQWKRAIDYAKVQDYKKALPYYQYAYKVLNYDGFFLYNYGSEMLEINTLDGIKILEEAACYLSDNDLYVYLGNGYYTLKNYKKAEECYLLSSLMVPCKFYPRYQLFKLYCETNQHIKARTLAQSIAEMNVKVPSMSVFTIKSEVDEWLLNQK